jgi:hypothetical protein
MISKRMYINPANTLTIINFDIGLSSRSFGASNKYAHFFFKTILGITIEDLTFSFSLGRKV